MGCLCSKNKIVPSPQLPVEPHPSYDNIIRVKELKAADQIFDIPITLTINKQGVCRHFNNINSALELNNLLIEAKIGSIMEITIGNNKYRWCITEGCMNPIVFNKINKDGYVVIDL